MNSYGKYKVKKSFGSIETHEVFLDKLAKHKEEELGITEKKLEVPLKEKISYILFGVFLLVAIVFLSKIFFLQVIDGGNLYAASKNNKSRLTLIVPERGVIYDKNLKKLVSNYPAFDLVCDRRQFLQLDSQTMNKIGKIAEVVGADPAELEGIIERSKDPEILISQNISHEKLLVLEARINELPDCKIRKNTARNYLFGASFSHLLGYMGRINKEELESSQNYAVNDYIGKTGIEKSYEDYLRGVPGEAEALRSAVGADKGEMIISEPEPGKNLVLNIDAELQNALYDSLEKNIKNVGAKKGAAVAMDPNTGAVLALVSYPSFDDNLFSQGISQKDFNNIQNDASQPLFNRAIAARYPVGSTIKPFEASAALQEEIISPDKLINDLGYIEIRSKYDPSVVYRFTGVKPHGLVDMRKALAVSSNIYFYTIGGGYGDQQGLGPTRIKKYLTLYGWGERTGIDIPGESQGFIPDPEWKKKTKNESWWDGDTYNLSIGQSDLQTTPLQVAAAYCAIANGGTLYKPQVVNEIVGVKEFAPEIIRNNFIDPENIQVAREGMRDAVSKSYGLATSLNSLPVAVAAKTGTAQIPQAGHFNTWIATFAPYDNPQIVLVITIENVEGLRTPAKEATREVLDWYFSKK